MVTGTGDTEKAVQAALSKQGSPYVWGATGPDNFDCSGLVQWAFKQAGITVSRTTYTQVLEGDKVEGPPQRGDLVFPDAGHVMIALGGDQGIHAPDVGDVVKISTYWTKPYAIRRIGSNSGVPASTDTHPSFSSDGNATSFLDVANLEKPLQSIATFFSFLMSEQGWTRMLKIIVGVGIVSTGSYFLINDMMSF